MTKLFKLFQKTQQATRQSFSSTSSVSSNNSSIRLDSTRPSIYLHNKSSRRSGVNKYTCSPRLTLYFQDMKNGMQLRHEEKRASRQSSFLLRQEQLKDHSSSFLDDDLRTNQGTSAAFVEQRSSLKRASSIRNLGLNNTSVNTSTRNNGTTRFNMGDYLDDNEFSMSMFQQTGNNRDKL